MENTSSSSSRDPIPLGLFGDSLTSLQGLNDQFSPMLLQRSPPSGSLYNPLNKQIVFSPVKQEGVLLSDLADGSPSAGSITVASLCNNVSLDSNLRCTNFVNVKGKRYCNKHMDKGTSFGVSTSFYPKETFSFISHVNAPNLNVTTTATQKHVLQMGVRSLSNNTSCVNGIDVSDKGKYRLSVNGEVSKNDNDVKKTTVPQGVSQASGTKNIPPAISLLTSKQATQPRFAKYLENSKSNGVNSQTQFKTLRLNVIKPTVSSSGLTQIKNPQTFSINRTTQPQSLPVSVNSSMQSVTTSVGNQSSNVPAKSTQSLVVDEATLKKLVDVLNSRSDMSTQQQISLLQSLGITVLQAPPNAETISKLNKKLSASKVVTGKKVVLKEQPPSLTNSDKGHVLNGATNTYQTGLKSGTQWLAVHNQPTLNIQAPSDISMLGENKKSAFVQPTKTDLVTKAVSAKSPVKRKQKPNTAISAKRSKSTSTCHDQPSSNVCEKVSGIFTAPQKSKTSRTINIVDKKAKEEHYPAVPLEPSLLSRTLKSSFSVKLPKVPENASPTLKDFVAHISEKMLLNHGLFEHEFVVTQPKSETEKNKTVKARLLKTHLSRKRALCTKKTKDKPFDYEHCLDDIRNTDFCKSFIAAQNLKSSNLLGKTGIRDLVHHEVILDDLLKLHRSDFDSEELLSEDVILNQEDDDLDENTVISDDQISYTINTRRLKDRYEKLSQELEEDVKELNIIKNSYEEEPKLLLEILHSTLSTDISTRNSSPDVRETKRMQCRLSNNNGLCCKSFALPYASYCKQHIMHCPSQCIYKLNQNMKPAADIEPELFVKRIRKRTKLPLIKKYKKKKKRKLEGDETSTDLQKSDLQNDIEKFEKSESALLPSSTKLLKITVPISSTSNVIKSCSRDSSIDFNVSDMGDNKPSDTSEEDLNLTGHEIMLNGVFDKLPEDPQDFDLFTTDKGAEELERALLLAATSPSPDHEDNKLVCETSNMLLSPDSKNDWSEIKLSHNHSMAIPKSSPGAVVVCDVPRSDNPKEQPPSFDQSQCVHYTFGSNVLSESSANDNAAELLEDSMKAGDSFNEDDLNLQDIERVLERLQKDADDINSPKLPSSPAVDQYTSMLAKQLSQEAEGESVEQMSSPKDLLHVPTSFQITKESPLPLLTRSYSLPVTNENVRTKINDLSASFPTMQTSSTPKTGSNTIQVNSTNKSRNDFTSGQQQLDMNSILPSIHRKQSAAIGIYSNSQTISLPTTQIQKTTDATQSKVQLESTPKSTYTLSSNNKSTNTNGTPRKLPKKSCRKFTPTMQSPVSVGTTISSKNIQSPTTLMANPVLPLTLMQNPSQNGNVIKVIVPPGTVVNGAGGQQNMLLIPVSALVKSGNQNVHIAPSNLSNTRVKTPLSSLQAGQQFFIVNNASANLQTQLALMQKRNTVQQVVATNNIGKDNNMQAGQKQGNVTGTKLALCNIKPNTNAFVKQNKNSRIGQNKTNNSNSSSGIVNQTGGFVNLNKVASNMLHAKLFNSETGKLTIQPQTVRRKKTPVTKVAKAKFDPVTKKYVPGTTNLTSTSMTLPSSVSTGTTETLSESMMKVQQINSVLSTLNSGAKIQQNVPRNTLTNGLPEKRNKNGNWMGRSVVSTISQPSNAQIIQNSTSVKSIPSAVPSNPVQNVRCAKENFNSQPPLTTVLSSAAVAVSTGTVHWNQTTTAGPVITTPTLTVPVYITGALPTATWPAELAVNRSVGGTTVPLIIPAHKLVANCQIPQRVLISNIASLAGGTVNSRPQNSFVTLSNTNSLMSVTSNAALSNTIMTSNNLTSVKIASVPTSFPGVMGANQSLKQVRIGNGNITTLAMGAVNVPKSKIHMPGEVMKGNPTGVIRSPGTQQINSNFNPVVTNISNLNHRVSVNSSNDINNNANISPVTKTLPALKETSPIITKKKSSRKASHDTIMHDPLMFDPTTLDFGSGELVNGD